MTKRKVKAHIRPPLTNEELESLSIQDFFRIKLTDDEKRRYREINLAREEERRRSVERIRIEALPLLRELRDAGIDIESVGELVGRATPYPSAIPILLRHLQLSYSDAVRATIARCLAVPEPEVIASWKMIESLYLEAKTAKGIVAPGDTRKFDLSFKDALACTLAVIATDENREALLRLLRNKRNGPSRILVLRGLTRVLEGQNLVAIYDELSNDSELSVEIASLRKFVRKVARETDTNKQAKQSF